MTLPGFSESTFTDGELTRITRTVYRRGAGPGVVVIAELPGITPEVRSFAERVVDAGFTVFLPSLFGTPNKPLTIPYTAVEVARVCIRREFSLFAKRRSSAITDWLRALARSVHAELGGKGIGAIGMCLTGGFALSMMVDPSVMAPVLSQPSLPLGLTRSHRTSLHVSDEDLAVIKARVRGGVGVLGLRFSADPICPAERFQRLRDELGDGFEAIEIDSSPGNPHSNPLVAHSVLTTHLIDRAGHPTREALDRVLEFFRERLL
jgi:dienelactone hydrolase